MRNLSIFLAAALLGAVGPTQAADIYRGQTGGTVAASPVVTSDPIIAANNQIAIQFVTTNFDYKETNPICLPSGTCDTETGWVPGVGAELSVMQNFVTPNAYFDLAFSYLNGSTDYTGALQGGSFGSVVSKSGAEVIDIDGRVGKGFSLSQSFMATPYVGTGFHQWDRGVNQGETYSHGYVGGGILLQWAPTDKLVVFASGLVGTTFASFIDVKGPYGFSGDLGDSLIWKAGGGLDYAITDHWHLHAKVELTEFGYGRSADHNVSGTCNLSVACGFTVWEPHSETELITVKTGVGYSWGGGYIPLK